MGRAERLDLIQKIEAARNGNKLICYVTGDRRNHETKIAMDIFPFLYEHLLACGKVNAIDLFLYTTGGDSIAGWGLVNLLREFCDKLGVIIPFRSLSCGTLIAVGANEIIMGRGGQLSPLDPSVSSPYNPPAPGQQSVGRVSLLPVSVEDMMAYLRLAREEGKLEAQESMANVMNTLSNKVHPLALGAAYRAREQGAMLATRLMEQHENDQTKVNKVVEFLTKALPSHNYLIGKREAQKVINLPIVDVPTGTEELIWRLYREYEDWLELRTPYIPETALGANQTITNSFPRAALESVKDGKLRSHIFTTTKELKRIQSQQPGVPFPVVGVQERILAEEWIQDYL
jgi:hypothetical protein